LGDIWIRTHTNSTEQHPVATRQQPRGVKVDGQVTVFVALKNSPVPAEPVDTTIEKLVKCVTDIVQTVRSVVLSPSCRRPTVVRRKPAPRINTKRGHYRNGNITIDRVSRERDK
jgi:hypothetical protein